MQLKGRNGIASFIQIPLENKKILCSSIKHDIDEKGKINNVFQRELSKRRFTMKSLNTIAIKFKEIVAEKF